ncbi:MAG: aminotransferase class III-fold pyridoxal phosphate-dependent enzyme [Clostridia bacterium]|nr:aminotransferase class III-fold pyridoxal phosphate-dependent enzyme [Clostridia bacterium]MBR5772951.1 aminotransferase class III-fold pyridoxal phosphate-dependent enzyme [Clostridia bacterium]
MSNGYAIQEWKPAKPIYDKLKNLTSQPIYCVSDEELKKVLDYFENNCAKSKEITTEAKNYIPGGVQHNLAFNYPFPICVTKAEGAYLYDIDGNKYFDFLQAGGPTILGSNYAPVREKVVELINTCGPVTGLFHEAELLLAKEINKHMPNVEMFRMLGSGTESVMAAIRVARNATKAKRIIKVGGAYHGWSDQMVYGLKIPGSRSFLESHGIPSSCYGTTDEVRPNDLDMLEKMLKINKFRGGTAAVIVEPVGPESGTRPIDFDYNKGVRQLCDKYGALFIFDEVVTGFRIGLGGAQGYFGVVPDLTIFGKVVAGGYPAAGGVGGKREFVSGMAAGVGTMMKRAYVGGTLAANPLSAYAGYCAIQEIEKTNACEKAGLAGDRLANGLQALCNKYSLPFVVYNQGSIVHLECSAAMSYDFSSMFLPASVIPMLKAKPEMLRRKVAMEQMGAAYMAHGIVTLAGSRLYTSLADTDEVIDDALTHFEDVFKTVTKCTRNLDK